ncbi:MAG: MFS transporter, partial [Thermoleophilia bacterium]
MLAAMTLANAMILVDQTAVPLTLPDVMKDLGIGSPEAQWILSGSLLALTSLLVLGGRLADALGRRRVFLTGIVAFTVASAVGGLAPDYWVLIAARVVQGAGGALVLPATVAIVSAAYPAEARGRALGTMGGVAAIAGALGPTIGGVLTDAVSWRAVLLVNVPLAILCIALTLRGVEDVRDGEPMRLDMAGAVLLAAALVGLVLGLTQTQNASFGSASVLVPLVVFVVAGVLLVWRERRAADPLIDLGLLRRNRNYLGATVSQGLAGMIEMGTGVIFPLMLILNMKMDPSTAGLALIPLTLPMVIGAPLAGRWYDRAGGRPPLVTGFVLLAVSGVLIAIGAETNDYWAVLPGLLVMGSGLALVLTTNDPVTIDMLPGRTHGQASGVSATAEQGGGAIGIA